VLVFVFIGGLLLGGLLNVAIIRLPREQRLLGFPRCTRTGEPLTAWQLIPVAGWLMQRGHASNGKPLHWIYPFVELLTATSFTLLYARYAISPLSLYLGFVFLILILTGAIDWTHRYIYTFVILGAALILLIIHAFVALPTMSLPNALIGMIISGIGFVLLYMLAKILFPSTAVPFGLGDVFLGIFIGAAVGLTRLLPVLSYGVFMAGFVASGLVVAKRIFKRDVPKYMSYGSYLCLGAILYLLVQGW